MKQLLFAILFVLCTASSSIAQVQGTVFVDLNQDCVAQASEPLVKEQVLQFRNTLTNTLVWVSTSAQGQYSLDLPLGTYEVGVEIPNLYLSSCTTTLSVLDSTSITQNIPLELRSGEPQYSIELQTQGLVSCDTTRYYVRVTNIGNLNPVAVDSLLFHVQLDPYLQYQGQDPRIRLVNVNDSLHFLSPSLNFLESATYWLEVYVDCNQDGFVNGQAHCSKASIGTAGVNEANQPFEIKIQVDSIANRLQFFIANTTTATQFGELYVWEDDAIEQRINVPILDTIQNTLITSNITPLPGRLYRGEVRSSIDSTILGSSDRLFIGADNFPTIQPDYANFFSLNDESLEVDEDCQQNKTSLTSNYKIGLPLGIGTQHLISWNSLLTYTIYFKNTGSTTLSNLRIQDTLFKNALVDYLQPSVRLGISSHPYTYSLSPNGTIAIEINTPLGSNEEGFVSYTLGTMPYDLTGRIESFSKIHLQDQVLTTNTTLHTLNYWAYRDEVYTIRFQELSTTPLNLQIYPNPSHGHVTLGLNQEFSNLSVQLQTLTGQTLQHFSSPSSTLELNTSHLAKGIYVIQLYSGSLLQAVGRLVVE